MDRFKKHGPFKSVKELVNNSLPKENADAINKFISERSIARFLVSMRVKSGITEKEIGRVMCLNEDDILELESSSNSEISMKVVAQYLEVIEFLR